MLKILKKVLVFLNSNNTSGESNGYLLLNLNCNWNLSPSYKVPEAPSIWIVHLKNYVFDKFKYLLTLDASMYFDNEILSNTNMFILTIRYNKCNV